MFHIYGLIAAVHLFFLRGCTTVIFPNFELTLYLRALEKYRVNLSHVVPPILLLLAKSPEVDKFKFPYLKGFFSAAAPLSPEVANAVRKRFGVDVSQGYGLTEASPSTHLLPFSLSQKYPTSVGHLLPSIQARLVDPDSGLDVGPGQNHGELWVRGPNIMKGYHNNPKATAACIDADGWLHTGDLLSVSEDGLFYVVDRLKELIKYKGGCPFLNMLANSTSGFQVPPAELEACLLEHPAVADCAVIGQPDESAGEVPRAFVVLKVCPVPFEANESTKSKSSQPGLQCTESEIDRFVQTRVAPHKRLRGGVVFIKGIPRSASGKILRRVLRDQDASVAGRGGTAKL
ncbi:hypothetical protein HDU83_008541 [Entophlyctis luteolus]|nr:hypothetical protein HDU83_008541 [Entophlyctis luteolus]